MRPRDLFDFVVMGAIWGASFLFMRLGAREFGPVALAFLRVAGAAVVLMPVLLLRGEWPALQKHWRAIFWVGVCNAALPFLCYTIAALAITAGLSSIFNATSPLWAALIAWVWFKERQTTPRVVGLLIGFAGVLALALHRASFKPGDHGVSPALAVAACLLATCLYGVSGNITKRHLTGVSSTVVSGGSQLFAALLLAPLAIYWWPAQWPSAIAWGSAAALAVLCSAIAFLLFFRLIARVGPTVAMTVAFIIPAFAMLWGWLFLHEALTLDMLAACGVILLGTGLTMGVIPWPWANAKALGAEDIRVPTKA